MGAATAQSYIIAAVVEFLDRPLQLANRDA